MEAGAVVFRSKLGESRQQGGDLGKLKDPDVEFVLLVYPQRAICLRLGISLSALVLLLVYVPC